ncbi:flagellar hook protein FlgE [Rhizobium sp. RAF36]|uniref:flagellar hook protein FlgE n=1 Tax=Rhizobium sp. RAF36 TaxID=3233055 RepID=UPI003F99B81C
MSIFGSMKTAISGMNAQANRLSTVADNIANVNTVGYKSASVAFSSLVMPGSSGNYNSGGVESTTRYSISQEGNYVATTSGSDLSIKGDGFFIVQSDDGTTVLTRSGDFLPDGTGNLKNSAGFTLMGYPYTSGAPAVVVNGFDGLVPINLKNLGGLVAKPSTSGTFEGNLNSNAKVAPTGTDTLPSDNDPSNTSPDTKKMSVVGYDNLGNTVMYDLYFTKTSSGDPTASPPVDASWEVAMYRNGDAAAGNSPFPYSTGPVAVQTLTFDKNGKQTSTGDVTINDPTTGNTIEMDFSKMSQVAADYSGNGRLNGQAPSAVTDIKIDKDGTVYATYKSGDPKPIYRIPLATVPSPDLLTPLNGNVYSANGDSGVTVTGFPQTNGLGVINSGSLETSNVDLADQLTTMVEAQRSYTANSKVFQTGSDILDVLVNLKR